jgi:hypothetical protein
VDALDTTVIPPAGIADAAIRPCSLPSLGSVFTSDRYCPECDRDLHAEVPAGLVIICEACVDVP